MQGSLTRALLGENVALEAPFLPSASVCCFFLRICEKLQSTPIARKSQSMEDISVLLLPEGEEGQDFRVQNIPGEKFRQVLIDRGQALTVRAIITDVVHGTLTPDGDPATLLIFEFRFISPTTARRFVRATITLIFEDANRQLSLDPEVYRIAPEDTFWLNRTTTSKDITHGVKIGATGGIPVVGGHGAYDWEMHETKTRDHHATLTGTKRLLKEWGSDNAVMWTMEENTNRKDGIPNFLRGVVLLRRKDDVPFGFTITIRTDVDFIAELRNLAGTRKAPLVDPVEVDPKTLKLRRLGQKDVDETNLGQLDLKDHSGLKVATKAPMAN
jgi:hypothetical protein